MRMNLMKVNDNSSLLIGKVTKIADGMSGKVVNVTIEGDGKLADGTYGPKEQVIAFWQNAKKDMASAVKKAGVKEGSVISVLAYEGKNGSLSADAFKYSGIWTFPEEENGKKERNVIIGHVKQLKDNGTRLNFSIPVKNQDGSFQWEAITIWDGDNANQKRNFTNAKKILRDDATVVVVCGENKAYIRKDGSVQNQFNAYSFDVLAWPEAAEKE